MLPSAFIFFGLAGQAVVRLTRGYSPNYFVGCYGRVRSIRLRDGVLVDRL